MELISGFSKLSKEEKIKWISQQLGDSSDELLRSV